MSGPAPTASGIQPGGMAWLAHALAGRGTRTVEGLDQAPTAMDLAMMDRALDLAKAAAGAGEVPVGAVVYRTSDGDVIAEGANTRERRRSFAGHAEFDAMAQACAALGDWRLNECTLVVTLEPCPMCAGAIVNARVGRVVFGASDPKAGAVRSLYRLCDDSRLNHRSAIVPGVRGEECAEVLRTFFKVLREERKQESKRATGARD